jgi:ABC-type amino acid transport substrate-binding protein
LRTLLLALAGLFAYAGAALAEAANCMEAAALVHVDAGLSRAAAAVTSSNELRVAVAGSASSILAGPGGTRAAYPVTLQSALVERLPKVAVSVVNTAKPRLTATEMQASFGQLLAQHKPNLVIWQTGTVDAMRGIDLDQFRTALEQGVEQVQAGGADLILMNMQYSPRTESMIAADNYAEIMRGVAIRQEIPLFDRLAVMKEWNDQGTFDLSTTTKNSEMAEHVHVCIGRLLADLVVAAIDFAKEAKQGK